MPKFFEQLAAIALDFPKFADGRCYSHARLLRERHGWTGELRAHGDILRDQVFFLWRCGIDVLEVREDNASALAFYAARGFTEVDRRPRYYRDGTTAVIMRLGLGPRCNL